MSLNTESNRNILPERPDVKYLARYCPFLSREVWAILTKQAEGTWRIVNCLDKDRVCFGHNCAFTTDGGEWPFGQARIQDEEITP
jgi:hypothetical protein